MVDVTVALVHLLHWFFYWVRIQTLTDVFHSVWAAESYPLCPWVCVTAFFQVRLMAQSWQLDRQGSSSFCHARSKHLLQEDAGPPSNSWLDVILEIWYRRLWLTRATKNTSLNIHNFFLCSVKSFQSVFFLEVCMFWFLVIYFSIKQICIENETLCPEDISLL